MSLPHLEDIALATLPYVPLCKEPPLPLGAGIYFALSAEGTVVYIGRGESLRQRWRKAHHRRKELEELGGVRLAWLLVDDPTLLADVEAALIAYFEPPLNGAPIPPQHDCVPWPAGEPEGYRFFWLETADAVTLINYHFVWIPKRRRKVLVGAVAARLRVLLEEILPALECVVLEVAIRPDHVHLFVSTPPTLAPDQIMFRVKGYTSRHLRQEFPALLKLPSLWTRSYFCSTAGQVSSATIQRYIEEQSAQ